MSYKLYQVAVLELPKRTKSEKDDEAFSKAPVVKLEPVTIVAKNEQDAAIKVAMSNADKFKGIDQDRRRQQVAGYSSDIRCRAIPASVNAANLHSVKTIGDCKQQVISRHRRPRPAVQAIIITGRVRDAGIDKLDVVPADPVYP